MRRESDLYAPLKAFLEARGYTVKGEVGTADIVACRGEEPPVVVELKLRISLALYHQAVARLALSDRVYIAVPKPTGKAARRALRDNRALCRRLGLGFITLRADGRVEVQADPGAAAPRRDSRKTARLLRAFDRLRGDPNDGGATRRGVVTGYRQDALACAAYLSGRGAEKGAVVARATGVAQATRLMRDNHYGWFERVQTGVYALSEAGRQGLRDWTESRENGTE
jgi:hypothetical protein